jgi:RND family efflux transporter MFP subunit
MKSITYKHYILAFSLAVLVAACGGEDKKTQLENLRAEQTEISKKIAELEKEVGASGKDSLAAKSKDVAVLEIKARKFDHYVQTQGLIEAEDNISVSAKGMGVITQVYVKEGQSVSKGQTLAQIDNSVILRNMEGMKSQLELARSIYERQKNLWDQKIGTEVQFLQSKTNMESMQKQLAALQEQNEQTKIKSPIAGIVDEVSVKIGENIAPGMPAARVINNSDLKVVARISESYAANVKTGNTISVSIPDLKKDLVAKVTFVGRNIDPLSRTFPIEAKVKSSNDLRPNMTALIKVVYESYPSALVVPVNTIQNIKNEKIVYTAEEKGGQTVVKRNVVTVKGVFDGLAQVDGLKAGDKVITAGFQGLNEGQLVAIQ